MLFGSTVTEYLPEHTRPVNGIGISETTIPHALELAENNDVVVHALCAYNHEG